MDINCADGVFLCGVQVAFDSGYDGGNPYIGVASYGVSNEVDCAIDGQSESCGLCFQLSKSIRS